VDHARPVDSLSAEQRSIRYEVHGGDSEPAAWTAQNLRIAGTSVPEIAKEPEANGDFCGASENRGQNWHSFVGVGQTALKLNLVARRSARRADKRMLRKQRFNTRPMGGRRMA
jgi:hypothetical protein